MVKRLELRSVTPEEERELRKLAASRTAPARLVLHKVDEREILCLFVVSQARYSGASSPRPRIASPRFASARRETPRATPGDADDLSRRVLGEHAPHLWKFIPQGPIPLSWITTSSSPVYPHILVPGGMIFTLPGGSATALARVSSSPVAR